MSDAHDAGPRPPMTRDRWARLSPLIDAALELSDADRREYIEQVSGGDRAFAEELARLVDACERRASDSLLDAAEAERSSLVSDRTDARGDDLRARLTSSLGGTYTIDGEIGGGGMSRVFTAQEVGLGRRVVVKVLPSAFAEDAARERFMREIKLAASLQQANIVPVLATGLAAGHPFYTMPLVEGRSLRERLARDGPLPIADAVSILRDVARALAFAHAHGVVHRDIKPANILLSDRTAVVTDFGIAKALGDARDATTTTDALTLTGVGIGTPAYMAPEQAVGDPQVDHRADIYAFGCLAYELVTGAPPFAGADPRQIIASHFHATPQTVDERRPDVPEPIVDLIRRCLEKNPSLRPQSADELLAILDGAASQPTIRARPRSRRSIALALVAGGVALVAVGAYYGYSQRASQPLTFAVVPFQNTAHDTALDYRSDGIGDEILNGMGKLRGIQIVGRMAAYRYKDRAGAAVPEVGQIERELGARLLVTGTLREAGGKVTISTQLHDATRRGELWSQSFTRDAKDLGSITDDIVDAMTNVLRSRFGRRIGATQRESATGGTRNGAALDLYLIGQQQLRRRGAGVRQAVESFERAIALDPNFGRAHAALATALVLEPFFVGTPPAQVRDRIDAEAARALALDSSLADAYVALSGAHSFSAEWQATDAEMNKALALEPDNAAARISAARQFVVRGKMNEALEQLDRARKVEPTSPIISAWKSYAFFALGRTDSALVEYARAIQLDSTQLAVTNFGALIHLAMGNPELARRLVSPPPPVTMMSYAPYVYAKAGDTATANRLARAMESNEPRPWFADVVQALLLLAKGDSAGALTALERSNAASGPMWIFVIAVSDPAYNLVRHSPRFIALLRAARLDPDALPVPTIKP